MWQVKTHIFQTANNKGTEQIAGMPRLVCAPVVFILKNRFSGEEAKIIYKETCIVTNDCIYHKESLVLKVSGLLAAFL